MTKKTICPKCLNSIVLKEGEFACPFCGELLREVKNNDIYEREKNVDIFMIRLEITTKQHERRKEANRSAFQGWSIGLLILFIIMFLTNCTTVTCIICFCVYLILGPVIILLTNYYRYKIKIQREIMQKFHNTQLK